MLTIDNGLTFDEDRHIYQIGSREVPSVTQIVGMITDKYAGRTPVIQQAAARGTLVHEQCERLDWGGDVEYDPQTFPYLRAYHSFLQDYSPTWEYVELPIGCKSYMGTYAGTIDRYGSVDGIPVVVDLKTTASFDKIAKLSLAMQLFAYSELLHQNGFEVNPYESFGLQLKSDGTYTIHRLSDIEKRYDFESATAFHALLNVQEMIRR